jgi:hypothetical protein
MVIDVSSFWTDLLVDYPSDKIIIELPEIFWEVVKT